MDGSDHSASGYRAPNLQREFMLPDNIVSLFEKYDVPKEFGLWSLDLDSFDVFVFDRILGAGYRPDILVVEVNTMYGPTACMTVGPPTEVGATMIAPDRTVAYGGSTSIFAALGKKHGYTMVHCEDGGINCFLVRSALLTPAEARCARPAEELHHPRTSQWTCMRSSAAPIWEYDCEALAASAQQLPQHQQDSPLEKSGRPAHSTLFTSRLTSAPCVIHPVWWLLINVMTLGLVVVVGLAARPNVLGKMQSQHTTTMLTFAMLALAGCAFAQQSRDFFWFGRPLPAPIA
jgi:hypothetical protein